MTDLDVERFWEYVKIDPMIKCWNWIGTLSDRNYGIFWNGKKTQAAHRFAYEVNKDKIREGLVLDHLCKNTKCVNPEHLEPVTQRVNVLRGMGITAINAKKVNCPKGHPLTGSNLYVDPTGNRRCVSCQKQKLHDWSKNNRVRANDRLKKWRELQKKKVQLGP